MTDTAQRDEGARTIGVALSGGGHRASAWALGALLYLHDSGAARDVKSIASVSGGSITNAWLAARATYSRLPAGQLEPIAAALGERLATRGTIFGKRGGTHLIHSLVRLSVCIVAGVVCSLVLQLLGLEVDVAKVIGVVIGTVVLFASLQLVITLLSRGGRAVRGFAEHICDGQPLDQMKSEDEHVFCATDVQVAEHVYLSKRFVYGYRFGVGRPRDLSLAEAVAASAAFPGAFPPVRIEAARLGFEAAAASRPLEQLCLLDGGIYDNMGEQWFAGARKRLSGKDRDQHAKTRAALLRERVAVPDRPSEVIVINGAPVFTQRAIRGWWPRSEVRALAATLWTLHDNATSLRRAHLVDGFATPDEGGTLIHIGTDPWQHAVEELRTQHALDTPTRTRIEAVATLLGGVSDSWVWSDLHARNQHVATHLDALGVDGAADLMQHAYALAAAQTHIHLGHPLVGEGWRYARARFVALARGEVSLPATTRLRLVPDGRVTQQRLVTQITPLAAGASPRSVLLGTDYQDIDLAPGAYLFQAQIPGGGSLSQRVVVASGGSIELAFFRPQPAKERARSVCEVRTVVLDDARQEQRWHLLAELARAKSFTLDSVMAALPVTQSEPGPTPQATDEGDSYTWTTAPGEHALALIARGTSVELVPLPMPWLAHGEARPFTITVPSDPKARLSVTIADPEFGAMIDYLGAGATGQARRFLDDPDVRARVLEVLRGKTENPFAAAAAATVLVLNEHDGARREWDAWISQLVALFPERPDARVLLGSRRLAMAQTQEHIAEVTATFTAALACGVPLFAPIVSLLGEGMSTLVDDDAVDSRALESANDFNVMRAVIGRMVPRQAFTVLRFDSRTP